MTALSSTPDRNAALPGAKTHAEPAGRPAGTAARREPAPRPPIRGILTAVPLELLEVAGPAGPTTGQPSPLE